MLKALVLATAVLATAAQAEPRFRSFSYSGLYHVESGQFLPNFYLYGSFESEDSNGNGTIERGEVTSFMLGDTQYVPWCNPAFICSLSEFSYTPGGTLTFSASWGTDPWGAEFTGERVDAGVELRRWSYWPGGSVGNTWRWTEQTRFSITPVPEPHAWALLGLGLAALALRARRSPAHSRNND